MQKKYSFLTFAAKVLRVVAWIVLVGGIIGSIILGISIPSLFEQISGATGIVIAVVGIILRIFVVVVGIIFSFLAWVFLLTTRELLYLFMDVEENTRNTAERIIIREKSGQD